MEPNVGQSCRLPIVHSFLWPTKSCVLNQSINGPVFHHIIDRFSVVLLVRASLLVSFGRHVLITRSTNQLSITSSFIQSINQSNSLSSIVYGVVYPYVFPVVWTTSLGLSCCWSSLSILFLYLVKLLSVSYRQRVNCSLYDPQLSPEPLFFSNVFYLNLILLTSWCQFLLCLNRPGWW
jgi:hypothetical protein